MLRDITSSQLTDMYAYYFLETGQYKKTADKKAAPRILKQQLNHLVVKKNGK